MKTLKLQECQFLVISQILLLNICSFSEGGKTTSLQNGCMLSYIFIWPLVDPKDTYMEFAVDLSSMLNLELHHFKEMFTGEAY